jgi:hypothetical protein
MNTLRSLDDSKIAELAGHTNRVYTMLNVFHQCSQENYQRNSSIDDNNQQENNTTVAKRKITRNKRAGSSTRYSQ